jgi:hypothetical protein
MGTVDPLGNQRWLARSQRTVQRSILTSLIMSEATVPNSRAAILERRAAGVMTWSGPS